MKKVIKKNIIKFKNIINENKLKRIIIPIMDEKKNSEKLINDIVSDRMLHKLGEVIFGPYYFKEEKKNINVTLKKYLEYIMSVNTAEKDETHDDKTVEYIYYLFLNQEIRKNNPYFGKEVGLTLAKCLQKDMRRNAAYNVYKIVKAKLSSYERLEFLMSIAKNRGSNIPKTEIESIINEVLVDLKKVLNKPKKRKNARTYLYAVCNVVEAAFIIDDAKMLEDVETSIDDIMSNNSQYTVFENIKFIKTMFYYGNYSKEKALEMLKKIKSKLNTKKEIFYFKGAILEIGDGKVESNYYLEYYDLLDEHTIGKTNNFLLDLRFNDEYSFDKVVEKIKGYRKKLSREYEEANNLLLKITSATNLANVEYLHKLIDIGQCFTKAMNSVERKGDEKTVFISTAYSWGAMGIFDIMPVLAEAKKRGCKITGIESLFYSDIEEYHTETKGLFRDHLSLVSKKRPKHGFRSINNNLWNIDMKNKIIEYKGLNVYQLLFDRVCRWNFSYFWYLDESFSSNYWLKYGMSSIQGTIDSCEDMLKWAEKARYKVRFIGQTSHTYPDGVYASFCDYYKGSADVEYLQVREGYQNYFSNKLEDHDSYITGLNITKNPNSRAAVFGNKEDFEKFYEENLHAIDGFKQKSKEWTSHQRANVTSINEEGRQVLAKIKKAKEDGKKVYLLNGKLIYDLAVRYTKGLVHDDMSDWITHTVKHINKNKDMVLIIKAHPHETLKEITMTSEKTDNIFSLIKTDIGKNIILMNAEMGIRNCDIAKYVDLGLLWSGTSALELEVLGVKTVMADQCGYYDYPIGFKEFSTREEYERILDDPSIYKSVDDIKERALLFLAYLGSDKLLVPNKLVKIGAAHNYSSFSGEIVKGAVEEFNEKGDEKIAELYDRII